MKHIMTQQELNENMNVDEEKLIFDIEEIISTEVQLREIRYGNGDMETDPDSITDAAKEIVNMLKKKGLI